MTRSARSIPPLLAVLLVAGCAATPSPDESRTTVGAGSSASVTATRTTASSLPTGWQPAVEPVQGRIVFTVQHDFDLGQAAYIDAAGLHLIPLPVDPTIAHVTWGPNGTVVYDRVVGDHRHIFRANLDGTGVVQLTHGTGVSQDGPSVSPRGDALAYAETIDPGGRDRGLHLATSSGDLIRTLTHPIGVDGNAGVDGASFSPDGRLVAYYRVTDAAHGRAGLWVVGVDGRGNRRLTDDSTQPDTPQWSPDGTTLVYAAHLGGAAAAQKLWLVDVRGGSPRPLMTTTDPGSMTGAAWSPDGKQIAFQYLDLTTGDELRVVDVDGTHMRTLWRATGSGGGVEAPHWSS